MKLSVIIGATGDIGRACAITLAERKWELILIGRDKTKLQDVASEVRVRGGGGEEPYIAHLELSRLLDLQSVLRVIASDHPVIHGLVNAAGVHGKSWDALDIESWRRTLDINLNSCFVAIKEFHKCLAAAENSSIVNITSLASKEGYQKADYAASKAALDSLTRSLAVILAPGGVRVNSLAPGPVEGKMTGNWTEERKKQMVEYIPLRRFADPHEIARIVSFLLSDDSSYINGSIIDAHGGLGCRFSP
ncbi:SDR family NAD(P)-dependent oxidoreductase [Planctomycetota bacterium]